MKWIFRNSIKSARKTIFTKLELNLSQFIYSEQKNALLNANVRTIGGIIRKTEFLLLDIQGLGESGLREIEIKPKDPNILSLVSSNLEAGHDETPQTLNSTLSHPHKRYTGSAFPRGLHLK